MHGKQVLDSSFRDPAGFLFTENDVLYRQVNPAGQDDYRTLMDSGLYEKLVQRGWLVPHKEVTLEESPEGSKHPGSLLQPKKLSYISYPYEWCFEQLRDAALLTLDIQGMALECGMTLKDASAFNVQFEGCRPVFIDTLSFETYHPGKPWPAYRQFCQHFLAPLALAARTDIRLNKLLLNYIDGIPLDLASILLPRRSWLSYSLLAHIHIHALAQRNYSKSGTAANGKTTVAKLSASQMKALIESLRSAVSKQKWRPDKTEWANYYNESNYTENSAGHKAELVTEYLQSIPGPLGLIQDLGANNGRYSRIAAAYGQLVVSQDIDPVAVSSNYQIAREQGVANILPLELDLVAPTPAIGWDNAERDSFSQRPPVDAILALALIHHLIISNNLPMERLAQFFASRGRWLIIEFVPKVDSQVEILLATRPDIFPQYDEASFEQTFGSFFNIIRKSHIEGSERTLYLMEKQ